MLVLDGNEDSKFNVNQTTGEIYIHGKLDREKATRYELTVVATDGKFSSTRTVIVIVADANDNDPQCSQVSNKRFSVVILEWLKVLEISVMLSKVRCPFMNV